MDKLLLPSKTTIRPQSLLEDIISPQSSSGPGPSSTQIDGGKKFQKIGKIVKSLRKKLGKILIRTKSPSPSVSVPVAHASVVPASVVPASVSHETTIDILPDDVLVQIIDLSVVGHKPIRIRPPPSSAVIVSEWRRLTHVCRRWRQIIFSSPHCRHGLDLFLLCTRGIPVWENLSLWPTFPIIIDYMDDFFDHYSLFRNCMGYQSKQISPSDEENIIAALGHPDRIRALKLPLTHMLEGQFGFANVAQEKFPILKQLWLASTDGHIAHIPSGFLGGSAPLLQEIHLYNLSYPSLPTLLSSATDLVSLYIHHIPYSGYISPAAMVTSLAALVRLDTLSIKFQVSLPDQSGDRRGVVPPTRVVLPSLTAYEFSGDNRYLEDLVAQIDAPLLNDINISYYDEHVFPVPQVFRLVGQTQLLEQAHTTKAHISIIGPYNYVFLSFEPEPVERHRCVLKLRFSCHEQALPKVSHLAEVLSQSSVEFSNVYHLFIHVYNVESNWQDDMDHGEWLELFPHFPAVVTLRVSGTAAWHVANALNDITAEMVPQIFPALRLLSLEAPNELVTHVEEFIAARQLSGLPPPVTITNTEADFLRFRGEYLREEEKILQGWLPWSYPLAPH